MHCGGVESRMSSDSSYEHTGGDEVSLKNTAFAPHL